MNWKNQKLEDNEKMKFDCINNQFVELKIIGYQFPEILDDEWDSNWLNVYINVKSIKKYWNVTDPAITTFELRSLIYWLKNISENKIIKNRNMNFTEPNISFQLMNEFGSDIKRIKINFRMEFSPLKKGTECDIELTANNTQLKNYAEKLEYELSEYPERCTEKINTIGWIYE
ncbi:MAG: hypothetical protein LBH44_10740 [Treponema sp.]|nr:hypothetical protein [Treponema sp.]